MCKYDVELTHPEVPVCEQVEEMKTCLAHLLRHEVDEAISNCKYEYTTVSIVSRLTTEELLIQGDAEIHVAEGTKVIFQPLPMVIGSNEKVTVTVTGSE